MVPGERPVKDPGIGPAGDEMMPEAVREAHLDAEAEADVAAGRIIPHEWMRAWLLDLVAGKDVPPPEA
jgi:hypothetical protein